MSDSAAGERGGETSSDRPLVLVVDDDRAIADTYTTWLRGRFDTVTAYGGPEALERVSTDVSAVLLDRRMPTMPGDAVLARMRERGLDCPVAMLTAARPSGRLADRQFDEYLRKPAAKADVLSVAETLLAEGRRAATAAEAATAESTTHSADPRDADGGRPATVGATTGDAGAATALPACRRAPSELERLRSVNDLFRSVSRAVVNIDCTEALAESVAELLTQRLPYERALVGEYITAFDELFPMAVTTGTVPDRVSCEPDGPIRGALDGEAVRLVDPSPYARGHAVARLTRRLTGADSARTALVVPIDHRETVRGVVLAWGDAEPALSPRERSALLEVGRLVGNAFDSLQSQQLIDDDSVIELELRVTDPTDILVDVSMRHGARVELDGVHRSSGEGVVCYLTVTAAPADGVMRHLADSEGVAGARVIEERGDTLLVECRIHADAIAVHLLETSGNVTEMVAEDGEGRVTVEFASAVDLRNVLESVRAAFPDVDLVRKRNVARAYESVNSFRTALEARLTERQDTVLTAADAGYFDWPRKSTAEEVAEDLGMAPPTMHEHLREAERKLVEVYGNETTNGDAPGV
ncbi:bacterio-opsin activator domain-containing protein [Halosegnis sp.]|uniref:bacterio-opsin activator domain-containing protein n=1 Tax=Halosegnis sp. TaxID=2864959 RepID=UPI0035D4E7F3